MINLSTFDNKRKLGISIIMGLLSLLFAPYGITAILGEITIDIPWSLVLPILAALAFGWKYGAVAGLCGGALFPFLLWANNGWANLFTAIVFLCIYILIGLQHDTKYFKKIQKPSLRILFVILAGIILIIYYYIFNFNKALAINPPFWEQNTIQKLPIEILYSFAFKDSINLILLIVVSESLLKLPFICRLLGLPTKAQMQANHKIFIISILTSLLIWLLFAGLSFALLNNSHSIYNEHNSLALFVLLSSGILVSRILFNYSENQFVVQDELNISERKYRELFEANKDGIAIFYAYPDGKISNFIEMNEASAAMLGYTKAELSVMKPSDLEIESSDEKLKQRMKDIQTKGFSYFETIIRHKNGSIVPVEITVLLINYNNLPALMNITRNITERKQAEENLRESELKYRLLIENTTDVVFCVDEKGEYKFTNQVFAKTFGKTPDFFVGKTFWDIYPKEEADHRYTAVKKLFRTGEVQTIEVTVPLPDRTLYFLAKANPIKDETGKVILNLTTATDITERKQAEEKLRESEAIKNKMVSNIGDVIVIIDNEGINRYKSPNIEKWFDWKPEDLVGKSTWDNVHPDDLEVGQKFILSLAGKPYATDTLELRYRKKDGSYCPIEITLVNLLQDPDIHGFLGNYHDISERKKTEEEIIIAKEKAQESDRLKSAFLANMSHEIRTPMNGILGFADLLKDPELSGKEQQQYIKIIEKSGARMLNIINDIVDISKIEAGLMKVEMKESNVNQQIDYIYTFFKPEVEAKGMQLSINTKLSDNKALITTDREKLYAIFTNLVKNAIKYSKEGSIELGYNLVETSDNQSVLEFYVKDSGIGIPKDRQQAVFERFIQADIEDEMARQGAGLGLTITKSYVEMLGGKIWVESEEGIGSCFYFTLPYMLKNEDTTNLNNDMYETLNPIKNLKLLIAEDDETSEILLSINMKGFCREILKAKTALKTVETCRNNPDIDLILMDIQMPGMTGYEACRQIREFNKEVIIIAQTAYGLAGDREKAIQAGCNDYITKPIKKQLLFEMIDKYFKSKNL